MISIGLLANAWAKACGVVRKAATPASAERRFNFTKEPPVASPAGFRCSAGRRGDAKEGRYMKSFSALRSV